MKSRGKPKATIATIAEGWVSEYKPECDPNARQPHQEQIVAGRVRRRIEDILEASRLEEKFEADELGSGIGGRP